MREVDDRQIKAEKIGGCVLRYAGLYARCVKLGGEKGREDWRYRWRWRWR